MLPTVLWPSGPQAKAELAKDETKQSERNMEASFFIFQILVKQGERGRRGKGEEGKSKARFFFSPFSLFTFCPFRLCDLAKTKTVGVMIIDHPDRLHE